MNTLKIKEMFPKLQDKKIDQVQKIINSIENKTKPYINMTTKGPLYKQIIVLINIDTIKKYCKNASQHIITINCVLKAIKLSVVANFIRSEDKGIVISINNITSPLDLQEIKKRVKSSLLKDTD